MGTSSGSRTTSSLVFCVLHLGVFGSLVAAEEAAMARGKPGAAGERGTHRGPSQGNPPFVLAAYRGYGGRPSAEPENLSPTL